MLQKSKNERMGESAIGRVQKRTMLKRQRWAIVLALIAVVLLVVALFVVKYFVERYQYVDVDGTVYDIVKVNDVYVLCHENGEEVYKTEDGYYQTKASTLLKLDPASGEYLVYAVVDTYDTEEQYVQNVLLYGKMTYDVNSQKDKSKQIKKIEVFNSNEQVEYTFERVRGNKFALKGYEDLVYDTDKFTSLAFTTGTAFASMSLENPKMKDGKIDMCEYGLAEEERTRTVTDSEGNETEETYFYKPVYYIITAENGDWHKIIIGDKTVAENGRYAFYAGGETFDGNGKKTVWEAREKIYIVDNSTNPLGYSGMEDILLGRIEDLISPMLVYPMSQNTFFDVRDFKIYHDIDYEKILEALEKEYGDLDEIGEGGIDEEEFYEFYNKVFEENSKKICDFSYEDLDLRQGTLNAHKPYISHLEYAGGYQINSENIDLVLYNIYATDFLGVEKLSPSDEDLASEKYGNLDEAKYVIAYYFKTVDDKGETVYIENNFRVSEKINGVFYAYSEAYDMIVSVSESSFDFLEWEEKEWYYTNYIHLNIGHVSSITVESPKGDYKFEIDDSASTMLSYTATNFGEVSEGEKKYTVMWDSASGKYLLYKDGEAMKPTYSGDYFIAPQFYVPGTPEDERYLFAETSPVDVNGDGVQDYTAYYFYRVAYDMNEKKFYLGAQISIADSQGNKVTEDQNKVAPILMETDYYVTNTGYLFLNSKDTYLGQCVEEKYGKLNRGKWCNGRVYVSLAEGKYVLLNTETGEWSILDDIRSKVFFCDDQNSRFAERAVVIDPKYENGKLVKYGEVYYPTTEKTLQYDEASGRIQAYNASAREWELAKTDECTIGFWNKGAYYVTDGGNIIAVNEESGELGYVSVNASENHVAEIIANGKVLNYLISTEDYAGKTVDITATDNFKQMFVGMLQASIEGMSELSEEEKAALRELDDFSSDDANNPCQLKITIHAKDYYGNTHDVVYRFYQYSERKSYMTVEKISAEDGYQSSSTEAYGNFYVSRTFTDMIINNSYKVVNQIEVDSTGKY